MSMDMDGPVIDCDVHHAFSSDDELTDYLPAQWRAFVRPLIHAADRAELVSGFVQDLLFLATVERFAVRRLDRLHLAGTSLRGAISGSIAGTALPEAGGLAVGSVELRSDGTCWRLRLQLDVEHSACASRASPSDRGRNWTWREPPPCPGQ